MNLHYKVELALDQLEEALLMVQQSANRDECSVYSSLLDNVVGARDAAKRSLTEICIKKAASAVGATEAAKSDSAKESTSNIAENGGDVKSYGSLHVERIGENALDSRVELHSKSDLILIYAAAIEACITAASENGLRPEEIDKARKMGEEAAHRRLTDKASRILLDLIGGGMK